MLSKVRWIGLAIAVVLLSGATFWMDDIALERVILIADVLILAAILWGIHREEKHHTEQLTLFKREVELMKEENGK